MGAIDHKCPNCAAILKFNPETQNWKCEFCKGEFTLEQVIAAEQKFGDKLEQEDIIEDELDENGLKVYKCNNCGANIVMSPTTSATSCIYCKNTAIIKDNLTGEFSPSKVIPFKKTKQDAIDAFVKLGKGRPLMPKAFSDKKNIEEMSGIYIPFWVFNYDSKTSATFDATKVSSWISGEYRHTKTDKYRVDISADIEFDKIPVDGSTRFADDIMNSIEPFDYKDLVDFNYSYLSGFLAEKYDVDNEKASEIANMRAENSSLDEVKQQVSKTGYTTVSNTSKNINLNLKSTEYILLPVWMLNIKYEDKIYTFAMNAQTGKLIGDIPVDKKKAVIAAILILLGTFIVLVIINLLIRM